MCCASTVSKAETNKTPLTTTGRRQKINHTVSVSGEDLHNFVVEMQNAEANEKSALVVVSFNRDTLRMRYSGTTGNNIIQDIFL